MDLHPEPHRGVRNVLLDLDDTLWENNLYFIRSLDLLLAVGRSLGYTAAAVTHTVNRMEDRNIPVMGFGYDSYNASYLQALRALVHGAGAGDRHAGYSVLAHRMLHELRHHPIDWLPGVRETLPALTAAYRTIVVTKGNPRDQMAKVHRSGIGHLFAAVEVVPHKNPQCYQAVLARHGLDPAKTVMVGNSPRSDINMARRAGMRTVYIPHRLTWYREMEPILADGPRNLVIGRFDELPGVLAP
jgi:putative hydrolase of the HAD superfamily